MYCTLLIHLVTYISFHFSCCQKFGTFARHLVLINNIKCPSSIQCRFQKNMYQHLKKVFVLFLDNILVVDFFDTKFEKFRSPSSGRSDSSRREPMILARAGVNKTATEKKLSRHFEKNNNQLLFQPIILRSVVRQCLRLVFDQSKIHISCTIKNHSQHLPQP